MFTVPHLTGPRDSYVTGGSSELKLYDPPSHQESKAACEVNACIHRVRGVEKKMKEEEPAQGALRAPGVGRFPRYRFRFRFNFNMFNLNFRPI